jgi:rhodanese-related sulfurtransferase
MSYKNIANELAILIGFSFVVAFTVNLFSPKGIALFGRWDTSKGAISAMAKGETLEHEIEISDSKVLKAFFDAKEALFVDARAKHLYDEVHIKNAVSFPVHQFDDHIDDFYTAYPPDRLIIIYCSGRECTDSHRLAQYLKDAGYEDIRIYIDGITGWEAEGYPVE